MINLVVVKNPFKTDKEIKQVNYIPGQTVFSYIQPGFMGVDVVISHNGQIVPEDEYQSVIPAPGDYIAVCPVIEGGGDGGGKDIGKTLAVIALSIVTMGVGSVVAGGAFWGSGFIGTANWGFWSWVAAAGVRVAGGYLINQWFPPGKEEEQKRVYGWGQLPPISTEGDSIPVTFGTAKMGIMAPVQTIAQHVTTDGEKQYLNLLLSGGEGPIDSIADLKINDNPYTNYDGVAYETRLGANDQSIISNFNDTYFPQAVSFELEEGAAPSVQQLSGEYSGIEVTLDFPAGLYRVDNEGKFKSTSVKVQLKTRLVGSSTWVNWDTKTISGKYTHAIRRVYNKHSLPQGQYEVSIQCTYKSGSGDKYSNAVHWTALSGIVYDDFTYPNKVLVGLKALATDQLSGGMPRITWTQTRNNVWVWDPFTGAYEQKAASNPAWACYDIIHRCRGVKNINTGSYEYSVSGVSAARIDYQAFVDWATFCDNRQIYFNGLIYQTNTLWESLKEPEQAGRGRVLMRGTRFSCVCDAPGVPVQLFNVSNTGLDSFKEEFLGTQDRANALELSFYNIDNNYEKTTIPVYGPGYDEETVIQNPTQVRLDFAMTLAQAYKYGAYQLRVNHYINRMVSWSADIDAIACQVGDVVLVQHDVPRWGIGGRITSATANTVTLDQEVTLSPGVNYGVMIRLTDDTLIEKAVQSVAQETTTDTLTATEAFSSIPEQHNLFSFGEVERVAKPLRLMSVSREGDFRCKLQGMEYIEELYGETTDIPIIDYPQPTGKISNVSVIQYIEDYNAMIGISWDPPEAFYNGARVIIDNKQVGRVDAHESSFEYSINHIPEGVQINIKIEAFNDFDNVIDDSIVLWTIQPKATFPPNDVTWGEAIFTNKVYLNWNPVNNYDLEGYEVRTDNNFGSDDIALVYRGGETHYTIENPTQRNYTLYIKAFSRSQKYSTNATPLTIENTIPIAPPQPTITEFFGSLWIEVAPNGESDIEKYNVYITPSDGAGNPTGTTEKIVLATAPNKITYEASPGQSFLIEIAAEDVLGEGLKSAPAEATTKHVEAPDIPDGLLSESKLENSLKSKIDTAKSNSDDYANQVIAYPTEEEGLLTELTGNDYTLKYSAGDVYVGTEIEIDPNGFFDLTDQNDNELVDANGDPVTITDIKDELGISLLGPGTPTWYGSNMGEEIHLMVSDSPAVDFKVLYGVKKNLSGLSVDAMLKRGVTAKQIDANVVDSIEAMRGFAWNNPVPADKTLLGVETRVTNNETGISSNQTSISQNATTIQTNATNITAAENNITANQTSIQQNADGINVNAAKIQTNESDISANSASIQVNADSIQNTVSELHSSKWNNLFTSWDGSEWICHAGNPIITVVDEPTAINGKVLQVEGLGWYSLNENIPFDPESMYIIKIRARQTVDDIGRSKIYCGVNGVAANGVTLINMSGHNSYTSQHYVVVQGYALTVADDWKEWTGYIQGYSTSAGGQHNNPQNPGKMYPGVTFIRPMFIVNYSGGTGTVQVDYMILKLDSKESWSQVNQLANEYTVKLQQHANGQDYIAGFGLAIDGGISEFGILADRFKIYGNPADPGETATPVFALDTHSGKLFLLADLIADGTITARMIGSNEIITDTANIKDAIIDSAKIINVEANKITTNEAKIQSAQIESIQAEQIKVGGQPVQLVNPKPQGAQLWHFDRSVVSTDGLQPESNAVYTLRPGEGKYGGAVAVEEGTTNLFIQSNFVEYIQNACGTVTLNYDEYTHHLNRTKNISELDRCGIRQTVQWNGSTTIVTQSAEIKILSVDAGARFRLYNDCEDSAGSFLGSIDKSINLDSLPLNTWTRIDFTFDYSGTAIYENRGYFWIEGANAVILVRNIQGESKSFATSFVDGTRANGIIEYASNIDLNEGTVIAYVKETGELDTRKDVFAINAPLAAEDRIILGKNIIGVGWGIYFRQAYGPDRQFNYDGFNDREWHQLGFTYKWNGTNYDINLIIDGEVRASGNSNNGALSYIYRFYSGGDVKSNYLLDELLVLSRAVSDEEIQSWYNSQAPFYDSESVIGAGRMQITSEGLKAYNANGVKTVDIGSSSGDAYFKGTVEAGALILPVRSGAPVG